MMIKLLEAGVREKFNRDMEWTVRFSPSTRSLLTLRMRPYGITTPYEFFSACRDYMLADELIGQITTPVLVTNPDNEQFWPGQSQELFDKLTGKKVIVAFTEAEGPTHTASPPPPVYAVNGSSTGSTGKSRPSRNTTIKSGPGEKADASTARPTASPRQRHTTASGRART